MEFGRGKDDAFVLYLRAQMMGSVTNSLKGLTRMGTPSWKSPSTGRLNLMGLNGDSEN